MDSRQGDVVPRRGTSQLSAAADPLLWVSSRKGRRHASPDVDPHLPEVRPHEERLEALSLLALLRPGGVLRLEQQRRRDDGQLPAQVRADVHGTALRGGQLLVGAVLIFASAFAALSGLMMVSTSSFDRGWLWLWGAVGGGPFLLLGVAGVQAVLLS